MRGGEGKSGWINIPTFIMFFLGQFYFHTFWMGFLTFVSSGLNSALLVAQKWVVEVKNGEEGSGKIEASP